MADPRHKPYPVRMATNMSKEQACQIRKWIRAQRPRISEAEGLRRLVEIGIALQALPEQPTRKRAEP